MIIINQSVEVTVGIVGAESFKKRGISRKYGEFQIEVTRQ
jgi:hypothetical protein